MDGSRSREERALLAALDPTGRAWSELDRSTWAGLDWDWVLERARWHKVLGLLASRLSMDPERDRLPARAVDALDRAVWDSRERLRRTERTLTELFEIAEELATPFLVIKGAVLGEAWYGDPTARSFGDLDIVVPASRVDAFDQALRERGWFFWAPQSVFEEVPAWVRRSAPLEERPGSEDAARRIRSLLHRHFTYVLRQDDPRMPVEVHWHVFSGPEAEAVPVERLWADSVAARVGNHGVRSLDGIAAVLHAAVHAMEPPPSEFRLLHLADVLWGLHGQERGRQAELAARARAWGVGPHLSAALAVAEAVFPFAVSGAREMWPYRDRWLEWLLPRSGLDARLVGQVAPSRRTRAFVEAVRREILWDVGFRRWPREATRRAGRALRSAVRSDGSDRHGTPPSAGAEADRGARSGSPASLASVLPDDLSALARRRGSVTRVEPLTALPSEVLPRAAFRIHLADGTVLKGRQGSSVDVAERMERLSRLLDPADFVRVLERRNASLLLAWVPGRPVEAADGDGPLLEEVGAMLGRLHATPVPEGLRARFAFPLEAWPARVERSLQTLVRLGALTREEARGLLERAGRPGGEATVVPVHADLCPENLVLGPGAKIVAIDNENLALDASGFDLARTWYRWPFAEQSERAFLRGYGRHADPSGFLEFRTFWEIAVLAEAAAFRLGAGTPDAERPLVRLRDCLAVDAVG